MTADELQSLLDAARAAHAARPSVTLLLTTLVAVEGSSYRQPGARLLTDAEGRVLAGSISGGCLEGDVAERARAAAQTGISELVAYDLHEDLETIWGFGTGCDGVAHVLIAPLTSLEALEAAAAAMETRQSGCLRCCVAESHGARARGEMWFVTLENDYVPAVASNEWPICFDTVIHPRTQLVLVGATRGAEAFALLASSCGWSVVLLDHRRDALDALDLPSAVRRLVVSPDDAEELLTCTSAPEQTVDGCAVQLDVFSAIALCTHRFEHDRLWLDAAMQTHVPYIGVLGSRQRAAKLVRSLEDRGRLLSDLDQQRLFAPIGLDIGGDSATEIALATIAEIQRVLHARPGLSLRERTEPLHTRTSTPDASETTVANCPLS